MVVVSGGSVPDVGDDTTWVEQAATKRVVASAKPAALISLMKTSHGTGWFYRWYIFSPASIGTWSQFSIGGKGHE